jgi:hypothetical protein
MYIASGVSWRDTPEEVKLPGEIGPEGTLR